MRSTSAFVLAAMATLGAGEASAQLVVLAPTITFPTPPHLVVVSPGVRVVEDYDQEVFFVGGWYWTRSNGVWYRTNYYRGRWIAVEHAQVPRVLVKIRPGKYRRFHAARPVRKRGHHHHRR